MLHLPCCVFDVTKSAIAQLHLYVFVMFKPDRLHHHHTCCLLQAFLMATAYITPALREEEGRQDTSRFTEIVNHTRDAICSLLNQLYVYRKREDASEEAIVFYVYCTDLLKEVTWEIERCFSGYCHNHVQVPREYIDGLRPVLLRKMDALKRRLDSSGINQGLRIVLLEPFGDLVASGNMIISVGKVAYIEEVLGKLERLGNNGKITDYELRHFVLEHNLNAHELVVYYFEQLKRQVEEVEGVAKKRDLLCQHMNELYIHTLSDKAGMCEERPSVVLVLLQWLLQQWMYLTHRLMDGEEKEATASPVKPKRKRDDVEVLQYGVDCGVAMRIYDLMLRSKILIGKRQSVFRNVAENGEFPNTGEANPDYLRKSFKIYQFEVDKVLLEEYLPKWIEWLGGNNPGHNRKVDM